MRDAMLPMHDRGFAYGDGVFETVLVRDGQALLWERHLERLTHGCERLGIAPVDPLQLAPLPAACGNGLQVLKIVVTRGSGGRGYGPPAEPAPRWCWSAAEFAPQPSRWFAGVTVRLCELRLAIQPRLAGIKHLARLENVLARQEWRDETIAEGLLLDADGHLVEATAMNLVWYRQGRYETPLLDRCGVTGTLLAELTSTLSLHHVRAGVDRLLEADAVWVCNSIQGVWPVRRLDGPGNKMLGEWSVAGLDPLREAAHSRLAYPVSDVATE